MKMSFTGSYAINAVLIAADFYEQQDFGGRIYTRFQEEPIPFASSMEMLMKLEEMYDAWAFPENAVLYRSFHRKSYQRAAAKARAKTLLANRRLGENEPPLQPVEGKLATFLLECKERQHGDWSGIVRLDIETETHPFRSTLELLRMMDSAVELRSRRAGGLWTVSGAL